MVQTITPVVYGGRARWAIASALHVAGATVTAALFGAVLGGVGALLEAPWGRAGALALAGVGAVYVLGELPNVTVTVPQLRRQVPDWWREFFSWPIAATLYGAGLGIGFFTYLSHGTLVVVAFAALASGDAALGALIVAPFGLVRGLTPIRAAAVRTSDESRRLVDRLADRSDRPRAVTNGSVVAIVVGLALVLAVRSGDGWGSFATAVLALAFGWAAISKAADVGRWRRTLAAHGFGRGVETAATFAVPACEAVVLVLAATGLTRAAGAWAIALLVVFTAEALRAWRRFGPQVPCGCFGGREAVAPPALLLRNAALTAVALVVALRPAPDAALSWPGWPASGEILPAVLVIAGLAVAGFTAWTAIKWLGPGVRT